MGAMGRINLFQNVVTPPSAFGTRQDFCWNLDFMRDPPPYWCNAAQVERPVLTLQTQRGLGLQLDPLAPPPTPNRVRIAPTDARQYY